MDGLGIACPKMERGSFVALVQSSCSTSIITIKGLDPAVISGEYLHHQEFQDPSTSLGSLESIQALGGERRKNRDFTAVQKLV